MSVRTECKCDVCGKIEAISGLAETLPHGWLFVSLESHFGPSELATAMDVCSPGCAKKAVDSIHHKLTKYELHLVATST